ncbi:MAG TPA: mannose-6-phosphate isomerase, class I [Anaerolineae bacterium]|nr:mannose-6-phosphate isomerase, class I [Anaerolineae bacterium]
MAKIIYPLTFTPVLRDYIWGGRNLETKLGRTLPPGIIAESWEISGHPSAPTTVKSGPLAGQTLPEVLQRLGLDLVGRRSQAMLERGKFPLLIKLLDANQPLSVQVHPNDEYANLHENGELGKTEMWYILHAKPGAYLIYGLKPGVTPASFRQALEVGSLESYLHQLPVKAGDAVFIPAGSVHAIMDGILLAEIQQNSDTTYRVYDWNRLGADGKPRPLHIDKAIEVVNFDQVEPRHFPPQLLEENDDFRREMITTSPYFNVERITFKREKAALKGHNDGSTFEIWGAMSGLGRVNWAGEPLELPAIRFTLLPAALGDFEIEALAPSVFLRAYVPE